MKKEKEEKASVWTKETY